MLKKFPLLVSSLLSMGLSANSMTSEKLLGYTYNWQQAPAVSAQLIISPEVSSKRKEFLFDYQRSESGEYIRLRQCSNLNFAVLIKRIGKETEVTLYQKNAQKAVSLAPFSIIPTLGLSADDLLYLNPETYTVDREISEDKRHYQLIARSKNQKNPSKRFWIKKDNYLIQKVDYLDSKKNEVKKLIITQATKSPSGWQVNNGRYESLIDKSSIEFLITNRTTLEQADRNMWDSQNLEASCLKKSAKK